MLWCDDGVMGRQSLVVLGKCHEACGRGLLGHVGVRNTVRVLVGVVLHVACLYAREVSFHHIFQSFCVLVACGEEPVRELAWSFWTIHVLGGS